MTKGRVRFTVAGEHPYVLYVRDLLIRNGFVLVDNQDRYDFLLAGGEWSPEILAGKNLKVLLLSSEAVYSDRNRDLTVADKKHPMKEEDPIIIPSPLSRSAITTIKYASSESYYLITCSTMALRVFEVYGPDFQEGLIPELIKKAKAKEALPVFHPGYQVRTFLHQDDFDYQVLHLVKRLLEGATGIYNVGSDEEISLRRLADSIWQLTNGPQKPIQLEITETPEDYRWWVIPDLTRTKALTKWRASKSLRQGLWELCS